VGGGPCSFRSLLFFSQPFHPLEQARQLASERNLETFYVRKIDAQPSRPAACIIVKLPRQHCVPGPNDRRSRHTRRAAPFAAATDLASINPESKELSAVMRSRACLTKGNEEPEERQKQQVC